MLTRVITSPGVSRTLEWVIRDGHLAESALLHSTLEPTRERPAADIALIGKPSLFLACARYCTSREQLPAREHAALSEAFANACHQARYFAFRETTALYIDTLEIERYQPKKQYALIVVNAMVSEAQINEARYNQ